ncbi:efflux RND transporter permease subunit [Desulfogranum marinum]|uniref:efflux RND transporter permease subunit n=1 Tax=Desulfogranum marinum TaxID=453220 RepID=UPI0019629799|nr:efflux RND transporter permease subunit [Desulfogranum marinum]MBM9512206.1 efflux RND transporter permease subunit [Desulfogranum marinum]
MMKVKSTSSQGPIAWMVNNGVTSNLLMILLIIGGLLVSFNIKKEVFPDFELDNVAISVAYSGASPEEVEQGILLVVEEAVQSVEGVKEISAKASEGSGTVTAELLDGADRQKVLQEIKQEIDRITTFPDESEEPVVSLSSRKREVLQLSLHGKVSEAILRELGEQVRDRLLLQQQISQISIVGARDYEIQVEISQDQLRAHNLTLATVAATIKTASVELPGGEIETTSGDILLRVKDRHDWAMEFSRIPIVTGTNGTVLYLEDIATVKEGFEESDHVVTFNGNPTIALDVYRVGDQTPMGVAAAVRTAMADIETELPPGIQWTINRDQSIVYQQRLELLLKNAFIGLLLVLVLLGLFLDFKLAFWVTMGIPVSFLGGMLFLPLFDVSINMISMFAFIVALGIVVDDAIIAGENIYEYRQQNMGFVEAAIQGAKDVAVPITFSILTNIAAFLPMLFVPGVMGKIWKVIPIVVVTVFIVSWVEAIFILPSHLGHSKAGGGNIVTKTLYAWQQRFSTGLLKFIDKGYGPALHLFLRRRYLSVAAGVAILLIVLGYVFSGRVGIILMPRVESDYATVTATLPYGSPDKKAIAVRDKLVASLENVVERNGGRSLVTDIFTHIDNNEVSITAYLADQELRTLSTREMTKIWRKETGPIIGLQSLRFEFDKGGPGRGKSLSVELSHRDISVLDKAGSDLAQQLADFPQVKDIDDGFNPGKEQLDFKITPEGESLGLTAQSIASQVRNSFQGVIALKQQRERNEVSVRVRLPESQRLSEHAIESMLIKSPDGEFVPLSYVAEMERGRAYTSISRREGRRTVTVGADVDPIGEGNTISAALDKTILPALLRKYPGLSYGYEGRQADRAESMQSLLFGFCGAMVLIYFLLAIPFKSYIQPFVVMMAIPFGLVGAVLGHMMMGYNLSVMSMMGMVALSGVLVNDSLVLIDFANKQMAKGIQPYQAIHAAGIRRFRPIVLTTLTTFGGLAPMIFETSRQARFMIPMALSLGYGIVFATTIVLVLIPCLFMITVDVAALLSRNSVTEKENCTVLMDS